MKNYTITVNGTQYEVSVEETNAGQAQAQVAAPKVSSAPKAPAAPKAPTGAQGSTKVNAPMPGKILEIKASSGQAMKKGQVILILEAMKMENEIVAPHDGTLASVNVAVGATVEPGAVLATMN